MKNVSCIFGFHRIATHLDYIYGNLPREHRQCTRCGKTIKFERPTKEREDELYKAGDIRDGDVRGCR